jgi:predicted DNA-binding transcriptional regulator AlpA
MSLVNSHLRNIKCQSNVT